MKLRKYGSNFILLRRNSDEPQQITLQCLLYLSVDIAGSGNPLQAADFCNWHSYGYNRSNGPILFAKIVILIHFVHDTAKKQGKKLIQTLKKPVFTVLLDSVLVQIKLNLIWPRPNQVVLKKTGFLQDFYLFFALFFAVSWTKCIRITLSAKRMGPFDLLQPQECQLQKSAAYRGFPLLLDRLLCQRKNIKYKAG